MCHMCGLWCDVMYGDVYSVMYEVVYGEVHSVAYGMRWCVESYIVWFMV